MTDAPEYECVGGPLNGQQRACAPGEAIYVAGGRYARMRKMEGGALLLVWLQKP